MPSFYENAVFGLAEFIEDEFMAGAKVKDVKDYVDLIVEDAYKKALEWSGQ
jgi:hypothetical protein